ncbi:MAG: hypothetical protein ACREN8_12865, partial [Candidatus Dormibacteraceae bacterium]
MSSSVAKLISRWRTSSLPWSQVSERRQWDADVASLELRHRLFHTAARVSHSGRQLIMRIQADWKWKKT